MPANRSLTVLFTGDLVLDVPEADHWLGGIAPTLQGADHVIGHLEVPHTLRGAELKGDVPAPGADPANLDALARAGFHMLSMAGNHIADCGAEGIVDTVSRLRHLNIAHAGAGSDLREARAPALSWVKDNRIALLSYNCVGPEASWAAGDRHGAAYLRIDTADGSPVTPAAPLETVSGEAKEILQDDIDAIRAQSDLVIVALHKGIVHTPTILAPYERELSRAAIDAGADVVLGHHAHIIRGIEIYRGKPIFHGLGNGCVVTRALSVEQDHKERAAWAKKRREMFGFEPDPAYTLAPFHPEAVNAFLGGLTLDESGRLSVRVIPVHVEAPGRPVIAEGERADEICRYIEKITLQAGLPAVKLIRDAKGAVLQ